MALPDIIIPAEDAIKYAVEVRKLMTEVDSTMERFTRPHPLRDLLDRLTKPGSIWLDDISAKSP